MIMMFEKFESQFCRHILNITLVIDLSETNEKKNSGTSEKTVRSGQSSTPH